MKFLSDVLKIAYLGPGGSYCEMAKDEFLDKYDFYPMEEHFNMISRVIDFVDETPFAVGVIPLENSIEGTVRESSDNLIKTKNPNIRILSEFVIPIKHCLLSKVTELYSITGVISHPQALAQCHDFISTKLPMNVSIIKASSTAEAAKSLDGYNLTYSAIGSKKTAQLYNLNIISFSLTSLFVISDNSSLNSIILLIVFSLIPKLYNSSIFFKSTLNCSILFFLCFKEI